MANKGFFLGRLAAAPTLEMGNGVELCRFTLIRNEYAGKDDESGENKERKVSLQIVAFGAKGRAIAENSAKGDQLSVEYRIRNNDYTKENGVDVYGYSFVLVDFEFGAPGSITREKFGNRPE